MKPHPVQHPEHRSSVQPGLRRELRAWWQALPHPVRARGWQIGFAALVILALLLGFHQVVRQSVRQGEVLRMSVATQDQAVWRCNALSGARARAACLSQLETPAPRTSGRAPPPNTASLQVAQLGR